ncbi:FecR family protein [Aurantimonas sp. A2-1-M11]|uniref:FecR family protein n=1 Tax=Aurantimonas sp. A2-1-M11 TaxID=3113712 RepID=UPI003FA611D2
MGDVVQTGPDGESQLLFDDSTRIVVGPSSRLMIESVLFNSRGAASQFAINALGGTFRFISGNSPKAVYAIRTPTATMSVRGTIFDFAVQNQRGTDIVLLDGGVRLCGRATGQCVELRGGCRAVNVSPSGGIGEYQSRESKRLLLAEFPYVVSQNRLQSGFRASVTSCRVAGTVRDRGDDNRRGGGAAPLGGGGGGGGGGGAGGGATLLRGDGTAGVGTSASNLGGAISSGGSFQGGSTPFLPGLNTNDDDDNYNNDSGPFSPVR